MEAAERNIVQIIAAPMSSEPTTRITPLATISTSPRERISNPYRFVLIVFAVGLFGGLVFGGLLFRNKLRRA